MRSSNPFSCSVPPDPETARRALYRRAKRDVEVIHGAEHHAFEGDEIVAKAVVANAIATIRRRTNGDKGRTL